MLEVGHTATRLSCFAPVSRCCDGSARAGFQTSKLPGSGVLATRYPDLSKPRVRAQAVPRPLPCSYGARRPWCARLGKASSRSEHAARVYVLTGSRAGPTPAGMEFNRPRTKNYSVAALSGSTIRGFCAVRHVDPIRWSRPPPLGLAARAGAGNTSASREWLVAPRQSRAYGSSSHSGVPALPGGSIS